MEWLRISTSTELVRVATDEITYIRTDFKNYDLMLTSDKVKCHAVGCIDDQAYFIAIHHKETFRDFTDALLDYSFINPTYITSDASFLDCSRNFKNIKILICDIYNVVKL